MATMVSGLGGPAGYGENVFSSATKATGNNDDGAVAINTTSVFGPTGIEFYGTSYTTIYLNSNGVISFGAAQTAYAPNLAGVTTPLIAPFWSDININSGGEIYWDVDPTAGTITMTWLNVAPYSGSGTNSFQVVLTDTGSGNFTIDYIYENISWTNGGSGIAQTGFTNGGANDTFLEGSGNATTLSNYETNNFDGGDPNGALQVNFANGTPATPNLIVEGTDGNDLIDASYDGDPQGDRVDGGDGTGPTGNADSIVAGQGNDTVLSGLENDTVYGGGGNDSIDAGAGDDTVYGDSGSTLTATNEDLNWALQGADGANIAAGFTQTTGQMDVSVSFASTGNNNPTFQVETTDAQYVGAQGFNTQSSLFLFGSGDAGTSRTTIDFAATAGSQYADEVTNVAFRINDIDWGNANHREAVTVTAYDANGTPVSVTITPGTGDTLSGNTVTAGSTSESSADLPGSALVQIAGPVSRIEIEYANVQAANAATHGVNVTDITFTTIAPVAGSDSIFGGDGADVLYGEAGDDTIDGGTGNDTADGGLGNDSLRGGTGNDSLIGGDGNDTLQGGIGADSLSSGAGMDYLDYTTSGAGVAIDLDVNTASGGDATGDVLQGGLDGIFGSNWDDTLSGYDGQGADYTNVFYGNGGNDLIDGRGGDDSLYGGDGSDTILGGAGNDLIDGGTGNDSITGGAGADLIDGGDGNDTIAVGAGDTVTGGGGDDLFTLDPAQLGGGEITINGSETSEPGGDTLDFGGLLDWDSVTYTNTDPSALAGTATLTDGTVVNFSNIENVIICFVSGTLIMTPQGPRAVETLRMGDPVITRDHGIQRIRWRGKRTVRGAGNFAPVCIAQGTCGNSRDLWVSPQHRMLHQSSIAALYFESDEVLLAAKHMVNGASVRQLERDIVTYHHILFDAHEIVFAEGAPAESFHPGRQGLSALTAEAREDLFCAMPGLRTDPDSYGPTARPCLRAFETKLLQSAISGPEKVAA